MMNTFQFLTRTLDQQQTGQDTIRCPVCGAALCHEVSLGKSISLLCPGCHFPPWEFPSPLVESIFRQIDQEDHLDRIAQTVITLDHQDRPLMPSLHHIDRNHLIRMLVQTFGVAWRTEKKRLAPIVVWGVWVFDKINMCFPPEGKTFLYIGDVGKLSTTNVFFTAIPLGHKRETGLTNTLEVGKLVVPTSFGTPHRLVEIVTRTQRLFQWEEILDA